MKKMSMNILNYYGRVIRIAGSKSLGMSKNILFIGFLVGGLVLAGLTEFGLIGDTAGWMAQITGWRIAISVVASVVAIRLILAPYWLHVETEQSYAPLADLVTRHPRTLSIEYSNALSVPDNAKSIQYSVIIKNDTPDQSIHDVHLRATRSAFAAQVIAVAHGIHRPWERIRPELAHFIELHPGQVEEVGLFGLPTADLSNEGDEILGRPHQFVLELIGRDAPIARATFEYDPKQPVKIRRIE